ncbi:MAG: Crp/Fnr family transcriptional regulator [Thermoanaerobaculia bacterium]|nr:Crp/Fnr family transcriptional regulator [Thermoanaerobaculia bacterium]
MAIIESEPRIRTGNLILDAVPDEEYERLAESIEPYQLQISDTLFSTEEESSWTYFPCEGVISFLKGFSDGSQVEVGVVGKEGMAGVHAFLGLELEPTAAVVQCTGASYRIDADVLRREFERGETLQKLLLRFTSNMLNQLALTAACNQLHSVDQRLARWLLAMSDRVVSTEIPLSHEFLAHMLGTGRARVTEAIGRFRDQGSVRSLRGRIVIEDLETLRESACECYDEIRRLYASVTAPAPERNRRRATPVE